MKLLLMRHSDRDRQVTNSERKQPLTEIGRNKTLHISQKIQGNLSSKEKIDLVLTSPYRPATETAEIVASSLSLSQKPVTVDCLAPENSEDLDGVIELLKGHRDKEVILLVGHEPQLSGLAEQLSSKTVYIDRSGVCCVRVTDFGKKSMVLWTVNPENDRKEKAMKVDLKLLSGSFFFLMDLMAFFTGLILIFVGVGLVTSVGGEGTIKVVVEKVGEATGVNGQMLIFLAGISLVLAAAGYARKAYQESMKYERGIRDTVRHFSPF